MSKKVSKVDLAWIAGFYEGEGCTGFYTFKYNRKILTVNIAQKDKTPLLKIQKLLGIGRMSLHSKSNVWYLTFTSDAARVFLNTIKSFIVSTYKRTQLFKALKLDRITVNSKYGSQLCLSKLTINKVKAIRKANKSINWLASRYKLTTRIIQRIKRKDTWKNV